MSFSYPTSLPLFEDMNLEIAAGSMVALTGASGTGKSTLLYLLGLLVRPQTGRVIVDGQDTSDIRDRGRARLRATRYGFVFQDAALDPTRSVLDNVVETVLYRGEGKKAAQEMALGLLERFGVDVPPTRKPGQLSGGQAARLSLCRALVGNPGILLADEPTGNLDTTAASTVIDAMREQANLGVAVVVATHDARVVSQCDLVVSL